MKRNRINQQRLPFSTAGSHTGNPTISSTFFGAYGSANNQIRSAYDQANTATGIANTANTLATDLSITLDGGFFN
jgi:hypothetical protein